MNTITLPRADWDVVMYLIDSYIQNSNTRGGSLDCILDNINAQLDGQEY